MNPPEVPRLHWRRRLPRQGRQPWGGLPRDVPLPVLRGGRGQPRRRSIQGPLRAEGGEAADDGARSPQN